LPHRPVIFDGSAVCFWILAMSIVMPPSSFRWLRQHSVRPQWPASPISRALAYLNRLRNRDGGFELTPGRGSDAQSTAWAVQAFVAAGRAVPKGSIAYLLRLRGADGSFRYSKRYATTPVWVTAQVLPALARKPFPLGARAAG
jgi:hypothetical protein